MIEVKHLNKHFNRGKKNSIHVLNDVSLQFPEKGLHVLLGPSGSGKTTLLNVVGGLDKVQHGEIKFFDYHIKHYNASVWDKIRTESVGYIFQNYYLMPNLSVFDNVAFVLKMIGINDKEEIETRVNYILKQVGMYRFRKKRSTQLSGGQQQRVAIARALVKNPKVIIADEPTGNLDSKNTLEIMNIIKSISLTKLVILVTHEKELANFYGDRIIEIQDGKIIEDKQNNFVSEHGISSENTIYLKDLQNLSTLKSDKLKASFYTDSEEDVTVNVRLIIKNKTLYIDIDSDIQKVKLLNDESHIEIKDAHYTKKTREELLQTNFDESVLDHSQVEKQRRLTISVKNSFWIAFKKILNFGRKGKLMLAIFMISGMLIAFSSINMYTILNRDYKNMLSIDERYIYVEKDTLYNQKGAASGLLNHVNTSTSGDYKIHFDSWVIRDLKIDLGNGNYKNLPSSIKTEYVEQLTQSDLYSGRLPLNENEVVISYGIYEDGSLGALGYNDIGIWHADDLIGEILAFDGYYIGKDYTYEIVGITKNTNKSIYTSNYKTALLLVGTDTTSTPMTDLEYEQQFMSGFGNSVYIFSPNYIKLMDDLENEGYTVTLSSQVVREQNRIEIAQQVAANLSVTIFLIAGGLLAFYFVMRSSMISRIYEISVYRALGVKKIELYNSFAVEIVMLTTISTFIGFVFMSIILNSISNSPLSNFFVFKIDPLIMLIGVVFVYLANLIIGLLPLGMLLRKTPAQIISSYDI